MYLRNWLFFKVILEKDLYNLEKCLICGSLQKKGLNYCTFNLRNMIFAPTLSVVIAGFVIGVFLGELHDCVEKGLTVGRYCLLIFLNMAALAAIGQSIFEFLKLVKSIRKDMNIYARRQNSLQ
jgi:hypothetical protein